MIAKDVERLERYLGVIDKELTGKEFIVGDSFSAADVMLGGLLSWLQVTMPEVRSGSCTAPGTTHPITRSWKATSR